MIIHNPWETKPHISDYMGLVDETFFFLTEGHFRAIKMSAFALRMWSSDLKSILQTFCFFDSKMHIFHILKSGCVHLM